MNDVSTIEVYQPVLEDLLSFVYSRVVPDFDHSVVNLAHVYLVDYFISGFATSAAVFGLMACEFFAVRGCIKYVEDVS